ncbi:SatD family protein [Promicromonospora thailandica]|uniref:SatD family protein n=1 Tax=Promicromonospora thailandica TaxID=765201 RepID=UPI0020A54E45|nr:SatD family protein [Promicromonospora thailandica]BFF17007.1 hypothetical protein GCM10025730_05280 [Promicromonospora thailandica]
MIVLTVDQRGSTYAEDRVPVVLEQLAKWTSGRAGIVLPFERTIGDEVQGVLSGHSPGAQLAVDLTLDLLRDRGWSVGIGVGPVETPLPAVSRDARGPAFYRARDAVNRAKTRVSGKSVAVEGPTAASGERRAHEVESLLQLLGAVRARRTPHGWEAVDVLSGLADKPGRQKAAAQLLGVSEQAVSQRVRAAMWSEECAVLPVIVRRLEELSGPT